MFLGDPAISHTLIYIHKYLAAIMYNLLVLMDIASVNLHNNLRRIAAIPTCFTDRKLKLSEIS